MAFLPPTLLLLANMNIAIFEVNAFQENTYIIWDANKTATIIDAGFHSVEEQDMLRDFVAEQQLSVRVLLTTHGHLDHIFGNAFVMQTYAPTFMTSAGVAREILNAPQRAKLWGFDLSGTPQPTQLIEAGSDVTVGDICLRVLFTPGHSPGHISFFHAESKTLFSGDVLFLGSIGRTDLPGGNHEELLASIRNVLLPLGDDVQVFAGHGQSTTLGRERLHNPYLQ